MFQCLKALNPFSFCITSLDYEDSLIEIEAILKGLDSLSEEANSKQKQFVWLEKAYAIALYNLRGSGRIHPDKPLSLIFAEIFRRTALLSIDTNPFSAKQLLLCSYNLHLAVIGVSSYTVHFREFSTLDHLKTTLENYPRFFSAFESECSGIAANHCAALTHADAFAHPKRIERYMQLGETVCLLQECYHQIDAASILCAYNPYQKEQFFSLAETLFLLADTEESRIRLGRLYLASVSFMIENDKPTDYEPLLLKAEACHPSNEIKARVNIIRYLCNTLTENGPDGSVFLNLAHKYVEYMDDSHVKNALLAELNYHLSGYLLNPDSLDIIQAEIYIGKMQEFVDHCRSQNRDSLKFSQYDLRSAELKLILNDFDAAERSLSKAMSTLKNAPGCHTSSLLKAEALKKLIASHTGRQLI